MWLKLKCIMLSEGSKTQKAVYYRMSFIRRSGKDKAIETVTRLVVARDRGRAGENCPQNSRREVLRAMEMFYKIIVQVVTWYVRVC